MALPINADISRVIGEISGLLSLIKAEFTRPNKIPNIWLEKLNSGKTILQWSLEKYKLQFKGGPKYVFQRDVFYCNLGFNVGSEQNGIRPVVVLQNNAGNSSSPTTVIAPVSTHKGVIKPDGKGGYIREWIDDQGRVQVRRLDYYEIPITLESNPSQAIIGLINVAQIKTISTKRLRQHSVARITVDTFSKVKAAMNQLFSEPRKTFPNPSTQVKQGNP